MILKKCETRCQAGTFSISETVILWRVCCGFRWRRFSGSPPARLYGRRVYEKRHLPGEAWPGEGTSPSIISPPNTTSCSSSLHILNFGFSQFKLIKYFSLPEYSTSELRWLNMYWCLSTFYYLFIWLSIASFESGFFKVSSSSRGEFFFPPSGLLIYTYIQISVQIWKPM